MRWAIVDNSTLTASQRLLGQIEVSNNHLIEGDILAFENLIQAILYYDKLLVLDDYKAQYRSGREKAFPFIGFIRPNENEYAAFLKHAETLVEDVTPSVTSGAFTDADFSAFFEMLKMNITFTWDMASSNYFLTLKMLSDGTLTDKDKFGALTSAIISQLSNLKVTHDYEPKAPLLVDSRGKRIESDYKISGVTASTGITKQTELFFSSLSWLAHRSAVYSLVANNLQADLFLHPIRNAFSARFFSKHSDVEPRFKPIIDSISNEVADTVSKVTERTQPIFAASKPPLYVAWLATKTKKPEHFLEEAFRLRESEEFVRFRNRLIDLEKVVEDEKDFSKFTKEANALLAEVSKESTVINNKYAVSGSQGAALGSLIFVWNLVASAAGWIKVPGAGSIADLKTLIGKTTPKRAFNAVYHNMVADLTSVERLGSIHAVITSAVKKSKQIRERTPQVKIEEIKFAKHRSDWKIPM